MNLAERLTEVYLGAKRKSPGKTKSIREGWEKTGYVLMHPNERFILDIEKVDEGELYNAMEFLNLKRGLMVDTYGDKMSITNLHSFLVRLPAIVRQEEERGHDSRV